MPRHEQVSPDEDPNLPTPTSSGSPSLAKSPVVSPPSAPAATQALSASPTIVYAPEPDDVEPRMQPVPTERSTGASPMPAQASPAPTGSSTNSVLYAVASFFVPGLGQALAGQVLKGVVLFGAFVFTCGGLGLLPFVIAADAYLIGERKRRGEPVGDWQFF